eukprot:1161450-Pelagomonas_calceolata.AAC.6
MSDRLHATVFELKIRIGDPHAHTHLHPHEHQQRCLPDMPAGTSQPRAGASSREGTQLPSCSRSPRAASATAGVSGEARSVHAEI